MNLTRVTKYPCFIRKFISRNILRFRTAVTKAIKHRKITNETFSKKSEGLHVLFLKRSFKNKIDCQVF